MRKIICCRSNFFQSPVQFSAFRIFTTATRYTHHSKSIQTPSRVHLRTGNQAALKLIVVSQLLCGQVRQILRRVVDAENGNRGQHRHCLEDIKHPLMPEGVPIDSEGELDEAVNAADLESSQPLHSKSQVNGT